jgi:translation elongation factor EF-G
VVAQLLQYGILTADEGLEAMNSGRLPEPEESVESQKKFKELRDEGYYNPLIGGNEKEEEGRPDGSTSPQTTKKVSPIGENTVGKEKFSIDKIKENLLLAQKLESEIQEQLKTKYDNKRVTNKIRSLAEEICQVVMANEMPEQWLEKVVDYIDNPIDTNHNKISEVQTIACEHQVDDYLASLLHASKI